MTGRTTGLPGHPDGAVIEWPRGPVAPGAAVPAALTGSVIIPAHDEAAVIGRTLRVLAPLTALPGMEVVVVCNGTTDATADIARGFDDVRVVEVAEPGKPSALNVGDAVATRWPRVYLDADIDLAPAAVSAVVEALREPGVHAARPVSVYDVSGASAPVRGYYRARSRVPAPPLRLWGGGAYAVSQEGHRRFAAFPPVTADDSWFDAQFADHEKRVVATVPLRVRTPRDVGALLAVLTRQRRGYVELGVAASTGRRMAGLVASVRGPRTAADTFWYVLLTAVARRRSAAALRRGTRAWERDTSTRTTTGATS